MEITREISVQKKIHISYFDILRVSAWIHGAVLYFIGIALQLVTGSELIGSAFFAVYYLLLIILTFNQWSHQIRSSDIMFVFLVLFIVGLSLLLNVGNRQNIYNQLPELFFEVIPFYFVGLMLGHEKKDYDILYKSSVLALAINLLYVAVILGTGRQMQSDNLAIAYSVLPHVIMINWYALEKKKAPNILLAIVGMVYLISMGSRGPVIASLVFIGLYLVLQKSKNKGIKGLILVSLAIIIIVFLTSNLWESFLLWLRQFLISINLSTRIVDSVLFGAAEGSDNVRMKIYQVMLDYIKRRPLTGYGIYGEWAMIDYTAHQALLEMWCHYGVVIGSLLMLWGLSRIVKAFIKSRNAETRMFICVLVSFGVVRCIFAGSYLSTYIFMLMGFCISEIRLNKNNREKTRMNEE